jgi:hypothetical protein
MQPHDELGQRRIVSVPSLIGWLSVCILAAAWGRSLDERWQSVWAYTGAYGLAAAVGLSFVERARILRQRWLHNRALQARIESGLEELSAQGEAQSAIQAAVRRLTQYAEQRAAHYGGKSARASRALELVRMEVTPVLDPDAENCELGESLSGSLQEVSLRGITFAHHTAFVAPVVLLTCHLDEQQLSIVVDVRWSKVAGDHFLSGGHVLAVGVPADRAVTPARAAEPTVELHEACAV